MKDWEGEKMEKDFLFISTYTGRNKAVLMKLEGFPHPSIFAFFLSVAAGIWTSDIIHPLAMPIDSNGQYPVISRFVCLLWS
jgi:hypothetical protein